MGAWVATVLHDVFHDTDSLFPPANGAADGRRHPDRNVIAGGSHDDR